MNASGVELTEFSVKSETKDGQPIKVLVIYTETPLEPFLPGDAEDVERIVARCREACAGQQIDEVRVLPWSQRPEKSKTATP